MPTEALWYSAGIMSQSASVAKLSMRHDAILQFMLANPLAPKSEVAFRFNVTPAWLSTVINSEAFLEARAMYTDLAFHESTLPMREKLMVAADKALDRLNELLPNENDLDTVRKTAESVLSSLGFGSTSKAAPQLSPGQMNFQQNNHFYGNASADVLARARERIGQAKENLGDSGGRSLILAEGSGAGDSPGDVGVERIASAVEQKEDRGTGASNFGRTIDGILADANSSDREGRAGGTAERDQGTTGGDSEGTEQSVQIERFHLPSRVRVNVLCGGEPL